MINLIVCMLCTFCSGALFGTGNMGFSLAYFGVALLNVWGVVQHFSRGKIK